MMRIGEVAEQTGLSISNIRFYEKKGLIAPDRESQNQYRDYTKEDVKRLKEIILYRKMDLSIETICMVMEGKLSLQDALERQLQKLKERQKELQGTIDLCEKLVADKTYDDVDVEAYLTYVKTEEDKGVKFVQIEELLSDFAEFAHVNQMIGDPYLGWIFSNPAFNRIAAVVWMLLLLAIPVFGIVDAYMDGEDLRPFNLLFWLSWLFFFGINFYQYRKQKNGKTNSIVSN